MRTSFLLRVLFAWTTLSAWINLDVLFHHDAESNNAAGELLSVEQTLKTDWKRKPTTVFRGVKANHTSSGNHTELAPSPTSSKPDRSRSSNHLPVQHLAAATTTTKGDLSTYWNLSCPLEMSTFSAAHIGGDDFLQRAFKARNLSMSALPLLKNNDPWLLHHGRRIFFVGDSLLRQVFISLSCLYWNQVDHYAVPWFERRHGRTNHANTVSHGPHSKFEEARVILKGGTEFIFHHGIGGLLSLGQDYRSHDPNIWLEACMRGIPFSTMTVDTRFDSIVSEQSVPRKAMQLNADDIVVLNGSVHGDRQLNLNNIADLVDCMDRDPVKKKTMWPRLVYLATGAEHFPTSSGKFEEELIETNYTCQQEVPRDLLHEHRQREEEIHLGHLMPIFGKDVLDLEYSRGDLHVGGRDCLHWIMPGIPDLLAASLVGSLSSDTISPVVASTK